MNGPFTTEEQAKQIASALLAKKGCNYERCEGAVRTSEVNDPELVPKNAEDLWIVYFEPKKRPGVPLSVSCSLCEVEGQCKALNRPMAQLVVKFPHREPSRNLADRKRHNL